MNNQQTEPLTTIKTQYGTIYTVPNLPDMDVHSKAFSHISIFSKARVLIKKIEKHFFRYPIRHAVCAVAEKALREVAGSYDALIPVIANPNIGAACMAHCAHSGERYIVYQVDPISTNSVYRKYRERLYWFEKKLYEQAKAIITTSIIRKEKEGDPNFEGEKIVAAEFPNLRNLTCSKRHEGEDIRCTFCGYIYNGIRDSTYTLELFRRMKNKTITLCFAGSGQEELLEQYAKGALQGRLERIGRVNGVESVQLMQHSDFLVNIGNTMLNQVPSKLFDYISTGKPIINICKSSNCPTIDYLNRYQLSLSLVENEAELDCQSAELEKFIISTYGKNSDYITIKNTFQENTAEFVAKLFIKEMRKE